MSNIENMTSIQNDQCHFMGWHFNSMQLFENIYVNSLSFSFSCSVMHIPIVLDVHERTETDDFAASPSFVFAEWPTVTNLKLKLPG